MVLRPTIRWLIILALALFTFKAHAQEFKADVTFITEGSCGVMPDGFLFRNEEERPKSTAQPCQVWEDASNENIRYVFLADSEGNVTRVLQLNRATQEQKEVWKKTAGLSI